MPLILKFNWDNNRDCKYIIHSNWAKCFKFFKKKAHYLKGQKRKKKKRRRKEIGKLIVSFLVHTDGDHIAVNQLVNFDGANMGGRWLVKCWLRCWLLEIMINNILFIHEITTAFIHEITTACSFSTIFIFNTPLQRKGFMKCI